MKLRYIAIAAALIGVHLLHWHTVAQENSTSETYHAAVYAAGRIQ